MCVLLLHAWEQYEAYTFLHGDGAFYANINKSLYNDGSLDQAKYHPHSWLEDDMGWNRDLDQGWSNVSLGEDGRWLPKHSWVLPLFATPFYALLGMDGLLLFHVLMLVLMLLSAFQVARRFVGDGPAAVATFLLASQPIVWGDVYSYNNDAFYSALLLGGTWAFLRQRWSVAGLLFGVAVWAKLTNVLFVLPFGVWVLWQWDKRMLLRCLVPFLIPIAVFLLSNWIHFGSPTTTSYDRIIVREGGLMTTESVSERFGEPFKEGLKRVATDESEGLKHKAPLLVLSTLGALAMLFFARTRFLGAAFLLVWLIFLGLHAKYHYTYARFFLPIAGLGVLPIAFLLDGLGRQERLRRWAALLSPRYEGKINPVFPAAVIAGLAFLGYVRSEKHPKAATWRMTDHVDRAQVTQGRERCDYFNNQRQKFECRSDLRHGHGFFWGLALGDEQCKFDGEARRMLWLHPQPRARERIMSFDAVPKGTLALSFGLAETSKHDDVNLQVAVNGQKVELPKLASRGRLTRADLTLPHETNRVQLIVRAGPRHWRHLCVEGVIARSE